MKTVKAIETRYKGYRFRSRLEARWAVFFDQLGVQYEYELEGFSLPSGAAYLPDFFLPSLGVHTEVKPTEKVSRTELKKMVEFALAGDHPLVGAENRGHIWTMDTEVLDWRSLARPLRNTTSESPISRCDPATAANRLTSARIVN